MVYDTVVMVMCNLCHSRVQVCVYLHLFVCYQHPYREEGACCYDKQTLVRAG